MPLGRLQITRDHRRRLRELDALLAWSESELADSPIQEDIPMFFLRQHVGAMHRLARAVLAQVRGESTDMLESRVRTAIEAVISVRYVFAADPERRALAFQHNDIKVRWQMAKRMAQTLRVGKATSMMSFSSLESWEEQEAKLKAELDEIEKQHGFVSEGWPSLERRAALGDSDEIYAGAYWLFSQDEHLSARGLNKYMKEANDVVYFDLAPHLRLLDSFIGMMYVYYVEMLAELSHRTGHPSIDGLARFQKIAAGLSNQLEPGRASATGSAESAE